MSKIHWISIPKITDPRGNLAVIENDSLPYAIQRVYYLYDIPSGAYRGGHAHRAQSECLIAVSGSFEVVLDDGVTQETILLNKPDKGLLIKPGTWRELQHFSSGAVCLVLADDQFNEDDYIRDHATFLTEYTHMKS